jgi:hypothetical protein
LFLGLSVGSVFILYTPLEPSIYSLGGIALALSMLIVAKFYEKMMHLLIFFRITLLVEVVVLVMVGYFLLFSYSYQSALLIYVGYQITFAFGNYLVRAETIFLHKTRLLSMIDVAKQKGYLVGLLLSYGFYKALEFSGIVEKQEQVYLLHFLLLFDQVLIIFLLRKAFAKIGKCTR